MSEKSLDEKSCAPCEGGVPVLSVDQAKSLHAKLHANWTLSADGKSLVRRYEFKGFAKSVYLSNLCVWLADQEGHHPDIAFGWGYCEVTLTTHESDGLSENDFIWAAKLDKLTV